VGNGDHKLSEEFRPHPDEVADSFAEFDRMLKGNDAPGGA
jgi:hypothetical protein